MDRGVAGVAPAASSSALCGRDDAEDELERRPDMQQAKQSLKLLRGLCKEYGLSFHLPEGSMLGGGAASARLLTDQAPPKTRRRAALLLSKEAADAVRAEGEAGSSGGSASSSSFEFSSEDDKEPPPPKWSEVRAMLDSLHTRDRVRALEEIDSTMHKSGLQAEAHLRELGVPEPPEVDPRGLRAGTYGSSASVGSALGDSSATSEGEEEAPEVEAGGLEVVDQALLRFQAEEMPVAQALRRCLDVIPALRERALQKEEARRKDAKFRAEEEERKRLENERMLQELEDDDTITGEVERKLRSLGDLPADADPDLIKVLEAQKAEARRLVKDIQDMEHQAMIQRLALDYVDNKLNYEEEVPEEAMAEAVTYAKELKAKLFEKRHAESEMRLKAERESQDVPTEEDVQEALLEQQRLQREVDRMAEYVRRMQDTVRQASPGSTQDGSEAPAGGSGGGWRRRGMAAPEVALPVPLDKVHEVHPQMVKECADLESSIQEEEKAIRHSESLLKNAEQTLKVIEDCKILFLEQVARERPSAFEGLLHRRADTDSKSSLGSSDDEDAKDEEEPDAAARLAQSVEERWLRMQLMQFEPAEGGEGDDFGAIAEAVEEEEDEGHQFDEVAEDLVKLAELLEAEGAKAGEAPAPAAEQPEQADGEPPEDEVDCRELKEVEGLSPGEAAEQLRKLPFEEVRGVLRLQAENAELLRRIDRAKAEIERIRYEQGATKELLGDLGAAAPAGAAPAAKPPKVDPELLEEVRRKVELLRAMRLRWWKERQDPSTTVRRALAAVGLPEGDEEDQPPTRLQATMFERIYEAMTMP